MPFERVLAYVASIIALLGLFGVRIDLNFIGRTLQGLRDREVTRMHSIFKAAAVASSEPRTRDDALAYALALTSRGAPIVAAAQMINALALVLITVGAPGSITKVASINFSFASLLLVILAVILAFGGQRLDAKGSDIRAALNGSAGHLDRQLSRLDNLARRPSGVSDLIVETRVLIAAAAHPHSVDWKMVARSRFLFPNRSNRH